MGMNRYSAGPEATAVHAYWRDQRDRDAAEAIAVRAEARRILAEIGPDPEADLNANDLYAALSAGHVDPKHRSTSSAVRSSTVRDHHGHRRSHP